MSNACAEVNRSETHTNARATSSEPNPYDNARTTRACHSPATKHDSIINGITEHHIIKLYPSCQELDRAAQEVEVSTAVRSTHYLKNPTRGLTTIQRTTNATTKTAKSQPTATPRASPRATTRMIPVSPNPRPTLASASHKLI